jgi:uncharacterized membrane protein YheB (UPF0754 family)
MPSNYYPVFPARSCNKRRGNRSNVENNMRILAIAVLLLLTLEPAQAEPRKSTSWRTSIKSTSTSASNAGKWSTCGNSMMRFESQGRLIAAEETLTACLELQRVTRESLRFQNAEQFGTILP